MAAVRRIRRPPLLCATDDCAWKQEEVRVNTAQLGIGEAAGRGQRSADEKAQS